MAKHLIDALRIGIRAQDIQTSVQDVELGALNAETKNIRLVGMAERLAIHIRGADVITDLRKLDYIASQLGIDSLLLPTVLDVLQELTWARVNNKKGTIEESVPYFSNIYETAGEYYRTRRHTEIEDATIAVCDILSLAPNTRSHLRDVTGLDEEEFAVVMDIGRSGKLVEQYTSEDLKEEVLFSPLYWVENPKKIEDVYFLLRKYGAEKVHAALARIKAHQGLPVPASELPVSKSGSVAEEHAIYGDLIRRGIILAPSVNSHSGPKNFAFTPTQGVAITEKIILEKAMAILSCIRYGEHFGTVTRLVNPEAFIDKLLSPPHKTRTPHSEVRRQYAVLVGRGVGKVFPDRNFRERYYFQIIATKENLQALRLAKDLLKAGEVVYGRGLSEELQTVLSYPGSYDEAMRTLPKLKAPASISVSTSQRVLNKIMDNLRGGDL